MTIEDALLAAGRRRRTVPVEVPNLDDLVTAQLRRRRVAFAALALTPVILVAALATFGFPGRDRSVGVATQDVPESELVLAAHGPAGPYTMSVESYAELGPCAVLELAQPANEGTDQRRSTSCFGSLEGLGWSVTSWHTGPVAYGFAPADAHRVEIRAGDQLLGSAEPREAESHPDVKFFAAPLELDIQPLEAVAIDRTGQVIVTVRAPTAEIGTGSYQPPNP